MGLFSPIHSSTFPTANLFAANLLDGVVCSRALLSRVSFVRIEIRNAYSYLPLISYWLADPWFDLDRSKHPYKLGHAPWSEVGRVDNDFWGGIAIFKRKGAAVVYKEWIFMTYRILF
jgi:hypothetical protein